MSDEQPDVDDSEDYDEDGEPVTGKGLRAELEKAHRKIKKMERDGQSKFDEMNSRAMGKAFADLDLDPDKGIGKAAAQTYEGDADGLAGYVEAEYGHVAGENPLAPLIAAGFAQMDAVGQVAQSVEPVLSESQQLAEAEADGDWSRAGEIQANQMTRMMGRNG